MEIIALSGFARAGKDEAASVLVNEFGFVQVAFADKLRDVLYALNPLVIGRDVDGHGKNNKYYLLLQQVIDAYGWQGYKETVYGPEIRRLLQRLGTEAGRQTLWDTIWIDAALAGLDDDARVVVSDARFFNEFEAVRSRGGHIWRIDRIGVKAQSDHPSETEALDYPYFSLFLKNYGTLEEWKALIMNEYALGRYKGWDYATTT